MNIADLRHRVTIEQEVVTQNTFGEEDKAWAPFVTLWAAMEPIQGREYFAAQQVNAEVTHRIRTRYYPGITPKMRVTYRGRAFDIQAVINVDERNRELHLMCREVV